MPIELYARFCRYVIAVAVSMLMGPLPPAQAGGRGPPKPEREEPDVSRDAEHKTLGAAAGSWTAARQRFGHTGFYLQWVLDQQTIASTDIRVGASDVFFAPQRARRVK